MVSFIMGFQLKFHHVKGQQNSLADCISRSFEDMNDAEQIDWSPRVDPSDDFLFTISQTTDSPLDQTAVIGETELPPSAETKNQPDNAWCSYTFKYETTRDATPLPATSPNNAINIMSVSNLRPDAPTFTPNDQSPFVVTGAQSPSTHVDSNSNAELEIWYVCSDNPSNTDCLQPNTGAITDETHAARANSVNVNTLVCATSAGLHRKHANKSDPIVVAPPDTVSTPTGHRPQKRTITTD